MAAEESRKPESGAAAGSVPVLRRPTIRERLGRRPYPVGFWIGAGILVFYVAVALSALILAPQDLSLIPSNPNWVEPPPYTPPMGPSSAHWFGVLPGLGVDLAQALWLATPWDLGIIVGVLAFDVLVGWTLGSIAGLREGGALDSIITWFGDTLGAIPSFFLVIGIFAGVSALAPAEIGIPLFVVVFGILIWPATARVTRDRARLVARQPYVEATRACGGGRGRILTRHVMPGSLPAVLAQLPLDLAPIFFVLIVFPWFFNCASKSPKVGYGAFGVSPTLPPFSPLPSVGFPEYGNLLALGVCYGLPISTGIVQAPLYWWMFAFPLLAILGLAFGIALVCDGMDRRLAR